MDVRKVIDYVRVTENGLKGQVEFSDTKMGEWKLDINEKDFLDAYLDELEEKIAEVSTKFYKEAVKKL